jgi:hypothetical protein
MTFTLRLVNEDGGSVTARFLNQDALHAIPISETVYDQLAGECPVLQIGGSTFQYSEAEPESVTYELVRVFGMNEAHRLFEVADPEHVIY